MGQLSALGAFHPLIRGWFAEQVGEPTEVQALAWPRIAAGEHLLISAPTGSGKTLTAFLWALQQLLTGTWPPGRPRVLYVSPLRALNNDVQRNLLDPLDGLAARFRDAGVDVPTVRVLTRSGDTPQRDRQRMLRQPPEVLITTPESLNILLTSVGGRSLLTGLETVILDEIHAVAGSKRGTHLLTAVERLVPLSGEIQRLALSATVQPLATVAEMVGGLEPLGDGATVAYRPRSVGVVAARADKRYDLVVHCPVDVRPAGGREAEVEAAENGDGEARAELEDRPVWEVLVPDFRRRIRRNRATLLFANSRRLTEKVTRLINEDGLINEDRSIDEHGVDDVRGDLAYSHHGSLSREVRAVVEQRLKAGELRAIVATNSLELGIDIGALDEVLLVQTPPSMASAVQRVGRAGHGVGEVSRGVLYPTHGRDFLDAAVVARAVVEGDIEDVRPITAPLDVLAQVLLSMVVAEEWRIDELFVAVRASYPYRDLPRRQFDLVLEMLAGRYADSRIRELRPRLSIDRVAGRVRARPGAARLLYMAGGTITDRGYFALRVEETMAKLGELDEEFVWERSIGDRFTLGVQTWRIVKITHNDVLVAPTRHGAGIAPFWRADAGDRDHAFTQRAAALLGRFGDRLGDPELIAELGRDHAMDAAAATRLVDFLEEQKAAIGQLPTTRRIVAEWVRDPLKHEEQGQLVLHTFWGGAVNRPLAIALAAAWQERHGETLEIFHDDDCLLLRLPRAVVVAELLALVAPDHVEALLRSRLEATGFFGSRFRANASTALLLPRAGFRRRMPLWLSRQRAKKLMEAVRRYGDFPVLVETWRTCLQDDLDLDSLKRVLTAVREGDVEVVDVVTTTASPFARNLVRQLTEQRMYEDDTPDGAGASGLRHDVLKELVYSAQLRPRLPKALVERFAGKVQRIAEGYAPRTADELGDWLAERGLIPADEWAELLAAVERDAGRPAAELAAAIADRALRVRLPAASIDAVAAVEALPRLFRVLGLEPGAVAARGPAGGAPSPAAERGLAMLLARPIEAEDEDAALALGAWIGEWLRYYGPLPPSRLEAVLGIDPAAPLVELEASREVVVDRLTRGAQGAEICDAENLEILLRWLRAESRPTFEALPSGALPLFLAHHQGIAEPGSSVEDLQQRLDRLLGLTAPAVAWERDVLPARLAPYHPAWLDALSQETDLGWIGTASRRLAFVFPTDVELLREPTDAAEADKATGDDAEARTEKIIDVDRVAELLGDGKAYELGEVVAATGLTTAAASAALWNLTWSGRARNDTFAAVRKGVETRFQPPAAAGSSGGSRRRPSRRARFDRWQATRPFLGRWSAIPPVDEPLDALAVEEIGKDRARLVLGRYGVVFRQLLEREEPALRWARVFRALRLMELSGEILAGHFFAGVDGLQFATHEAFRRLRRGLAEDTVFWLGAADPASCCGLDIEELKGELPRRHATSHTVFHGRRLVVVGQRNARHLDIRVAAEHPRLKDYLEFLKTLLSRDVQPLTSITVETINGVPASESPFVAALEPSFQLTRENGAVKLWKRF